MSRKSRMLKFVSLVLPVLLMVFSLAYSATETIKLPGNRTTQWEKAKLPAKVSQARVIPNAKDPSKNYAPGELIIRYNDDVAQSHATQLTQSFGFKLKRQGAYLNYQVAKLPSSISVEDAIKKVQKDPNVLYAEPNWYCYASMIPNDPYFNDTTWFEEGGIDPDEGITLGVFGTSSDYLYVATYQPYLYIMGMPDLPGVSFSDIVAPGFISGLNEGIWSVTQGDGIKVAVIDTGIDFYHEDLRGQYLAGFDYVDNDAFPMDSATVGHGSHVSGIIAAATNNRKGIAGMAPKVKIIPIRVLGTDGTGTDADVADGIIAAGKRFKANIINMSLGGEAAFYADHAKILYEAITEVKKYGCHIVCSAGNESINYNAEGETRWTFPAMFSGVISVGSWDYLYDDSGVPIKVGYSNYGYQIIDNPDRFGLTFDSEFYGDIRGVDIFAPGGSDSYYPVVSCFPYRAGAPTADRYQGMMGTSMAAPHVSAYVAMLMTRGITDRKSMLYSLYSTSYNPNNFLYGNFTADWGFGMIDPMYGIYLYEVNQNLAITNYVVNDASTYNIVNNANQILDPGETIDLYLSVTNTGNNVAKNVYGVLSTSDSNVTFIQREAAYGDIESNITLENTTPYKLSLSKVDIGSGYEIRFMLYASYDTGTGDRVTVALPVDIPVSEKGAFISSGGLYHTIDLAKEDPTQKPYDGGLYRYLFDDNNTDDRTSSFMGRQEQDGTPVGNSDNYLNIKESRVEFSPELLNNTGTNFTITNSTQSTSPLTGSINIYRDTNPDGGLLSLTDSFEYYLTGTTAFAIGTTSVNAPYVGSVAYPEFDFNVSVRDYTPESGGDEEKGLIKVKNHSPDKAFGYAILEWDLQAYGNVTANWLDRVPVTYCHVTALALDHIEISDPNDNKVIEPGETIRMKAFIRNSSNLPVTSAVAALLTTSDPYVTVAVYRSDYNIPGLDGYPGSKTERATFSPNNSGFEFTVSPDAPQNHVIEFNLEIGGGLDTGSLDTAKDFLPDDQTWNCPFVVDMGQFSLYDGRNSKHTIVIDDTVADVTTSAFNNGNGSINPGEMINMNLSFWNRYFDQQINGVRAMLSTYDPNVNLVKNNVFVGKVGARSITNLPEPFKFYTPIDFSADTIAFILTLLDDQGLQYISTFVVNVEKTYPPQVAGFPFNTGSPIRCAPTIADLDKDGIADIIIGNEAGYINAIKLALPDADATSAATLPGWPVNANGEAIREAVAVGDIDGSGTNSVVAVSEGGNLFAWKADGTPWGTNGLIWSRANSSMRLLSAPVLVDLNNDGAKEIVIGGQNIDGIDTWGLLYAFNYQGSAIGAFGTGSTTLLGPINAAPAVGNITGDDTPEVIVTTQGGEMAVFDSVGNRIIYRLEATVPINAPPVLFDINNDGALDVVAKASNGNLFAWGADGNRIEGFPINIGGSQVTPPAIGDLNADGYPELLVGGTDSLKMITYENNMPTESLTIPVTGYYSNSQPAIADINKDDLPEILVSAQDGRLYTLEANGTEIYRTPDHQFQDSAPAVGTFSNPYAYLINGEAANNAAVVGSRDGYVYAYIHYYESAPQSAYWPQFRHDKFNSGLYEQPSDSFNMAIRWSTNSNPYASVFDYTNDIDWLSFMGISGHNYQISVITPAGSTANPLIALCDSTGTQMTGFVTSIEKSLNQDGIYYVQIKNGNSNFGAAATYQVIITDVTDITVIPANIWEELSE